MFPGPIAIRPPSRNELDTRQEFVRADYNISANWSLTGRYLHDRVDSRGEYASTPDFAPGHRYHGRPPRRGRGPAGQEHGSCTNCRTSCRRHAAVRGTTRTHTRGDWGLLIPELFPENAANLIPNISVTGLSPLGRSPAADPREYLNHTFSSALTCAARHSHAEGGRPVRARARELESLSGNRRRGHSAFRPGGGFTAFQNFLRGNAAGACGEQLQLFRNRHRRHQPASGLDRYEAVPSRIRGECIRRSRSISGSATRSIRR